MPRATLPFFFLTGDENFYDVIDQKCLDRVFGEGVENASQLNSVKVFKELTKKYNVFYLHKYFHSDKADKDVVS